MKVNWGILSTANIARKAIIPALIDAENCEVRAIASSNAKVDEIAKEFDIPTVYKSYEELIDDNSIEVVYIPLPNALHKEGVLKAAARGKHILVEKPAALTSEDVEEMKRACEENDVLLMEAFMYQFQPQHQRVKEIIATGEIGEVRHLNSAFTFSLNFEENRQNIRLNPELGGGSIWDVGCYCIHSTRMILEEEPTSVYVSGDIHPEFGIDTKATGILNFSNGVTATFYSSFEESMRNTYEVRGTKGSIFLPNAYRSDKVGEGEGEILITNESGETRTEMVKGQQYVMQVQHFSDCVLTGETPSYTITQTTQNIKTIEACYRSLREGQCTGV
ncbi:Gfo/Idh/MocA family protein [Bacillus sp. 2205SS5-2]|uniref:Gfo/Idh/MocA family protein n=1 Tax=Bacillus sp. 2205SS5-2 TaxID=3109031 RepID=UPI00300447F4